MSDEPLPRDPRASVINDVSAWVLRLGVICSVVVMVAGIFLSFVRGRVSLERIQTARFDYNPGQLLHGIAHGRGQSIIEAGIYLLVLTPVVRVLMSMILFVFAERDWVYGAITLVVLALTLTGLLWLG
jgi:uncharacterized membrane protein